MLPRTYGCFAALLFCGLQCVNVYADYAFYTVPNTNLRIMLEGRAKHLPGGTATVRHPMGVLAFSSQDIRIIESPSRNDLFGIELREARKKGTPDALISAAKWAIQHGLLKECKRTLGEAWKLNPEHEMLKKLAKLMQYLNASVPQDSVQEQEVRQLVGGQDLKLLRGRHFTLYHDVPEPKSRNEKSRAVQRLELLEQVYDSFFLTFAFEGLFLRPPRKPMPVILYNEHSKFMLLERRFEMPLRYVAGFYIPEHNISVFYDSATTKQWQVLAEFQREMKTVVDELKRLRAPGGGEAIRLFKTLDLLLEIERESEDVKTVSHEAVHQLAANAGLFPRDGVFVRWVHEGLASFFESQKMSYWAGVGNVDEYRLAAYRQLAPDPVRGSADFVLSDLSFSLSGPVENQLGAYGQAWGLTHFLFNRRFRDLIRFYKEVQTIEGEVENLEDLQARANALLEISDRVFGDRAALELQWKSYMKDLKTDLERTLQANR